jgi:hypothetical protein
MALAPAGGRVPKAVKILESQHCGDVACLTRNPHTGFHALIKSLSFLCTQDEGPIYKWPSLNSTSPVLY